MISRNALISPFKKRQLPMFLLSALVLGSCTSTPANGPDTVQSGEKLQVMTTFVPITSFTKAVAGDRAQVTQLLPNNVGPHDYQARPADVQRLTSADVVVKNGLEMEIFLEDMLNNVDSDKLTVIDSSKGIAVIPNEEEHGEHHEKEHADGEHEHEGEDHHSEGKEHAEGEAHADGKEHAGEGHDHGENNPHIWLDPKRAIQQVENIRDGLVAADPEGKPVYEANAAAYIAELKKLDTEFTQQLQPYTGKTFVTYHDFADYFARSYNLQVESLVGVPHENATPEDVRRVVEAAKASNLKTLLSEPQVLDNPFKALATDLKVNVGTFDPLEAGGAEALEAGYYISVMRKNLNSLTNAFSGQPQAWVPALPRQRTIATLPQWIWG